MVDRGGVCEASMSAVGGSDRGVDILCDPCKVDETLSEGIGFCTQCQEYLCTDCLREHKNHRALMRHNILQGSDLPTSRCQNASTDDSVLCDLHHKDITQFCVDHNAPLCDVCLILDHSKCKGVTDISQISKTDGHPDKVYDFLCYIKSLIEEFKDLEKQNFTQKETITKQTQECYDRIKSFRQDIDSFLDKLEKEIRHEVDHAVEENMKTLSNRVTTIEHALKVMDLAIDNIEKAKQVGENCTFLSLNKLRPRVENAEDRLQDTVNEQQDINITFKVESMLKDLLSKCTQFGTIIVERTDTCSRYKIPGYLKDRSIEKSSKVNVKVHGDNSECEITGIYVLDNGDTLMCDRVNKKVKLMDSSGHITSSLRMVSGPYDVTCITKTDAAVTLPNKKMIEIVRIEGRHLQLQKGRRMKLDRTCYGLAYHIDNLYVICHDSPGNNEVICLNKQGQLINRVSSPDNLQYPNYIDVDREGRMHLSDNDTNLTCMNLSGKTVYSYTQARIGLYYPRGLLVDRYKSVYCVGHWSHNLQIIARNKVYRTLVNKGQGLVSPRCLSYRRCDKTLIVGMDGDNIQLYKFA